MVISIIISIKDKDELIDLIPLKLKNKYNQVELKTLFLDENYKKKFINIEIANKIIIFEKLIDKANYFLDDNYYMKSLNYYIYAYSLFKCLKFNNFDYLFNDLTKLEILEIIIENDSYNNSFLFKIYILISINYLKIYNFKNAKIMINKAFDINSSSSIVNLIYSKCILYNNSSKLNEINDAIKKLDYVLKYNINNEKLYSYNQNILKFLGLNNIKNNMIKIKNKLNFKKIKLLATRIYINNLKDKYNINNRFSYYTQEVKKIILILTEIKKISKLKNIDEYIRSKNILKEIFLIKKNNRISIETKEKYIRKIYENTKFNYKTIDLANKIYFSKKQYIKEKQIIIKNKNQIFLKNKLFYSMLLIVLILFLNTFLIK